MIHNEYFQNFHNIYARYIMSCIIYPYSDATEIISFESVVLVHAQMYLK